MSTERPYGDNQRRLANADPLESYRVAIVVKGQRRATLAGRDIDQLKGRAFNFAAAQGWHRPIVEVLT
ncbi:hypothetical protein [Halomonas urumqiensis]|uniref:Uncharacterized protein n=1 Tax=Halomonas urumqiensis TaxID=1684789 RepID=A0A2N7UFB1_9GAMM|nr:hypothetical protein [Halomonas urumqiensis]PMR79100.1 hypothetical protein C1H70_12390 [Halomonas urumqiensis]PTB03774.1 hypothetical protein C6V82_04675 [Halomonas urumqiensis]GHE19999.1 hypothetical protein GCM10017767_05200 [Halomonas urumqiensis]